VPGSTVIDDYNCNIACSSAGLSPTGASVGGTKSDLDTVRVGVDTAF